MELFSTYPEEASIVALKNLSSTLCVSLPLAHIHPNIALALKAVKVAAAESGEVPRPLSPVKGHRAPSTRQSLRAFRGSVHQNRQLSCSLQRDTCDEVPLSSRRRMISYLEPGSGLLRKSRYARRQFMDHSLDRDRTRLDFLADGGADFEHAITVTGFGRFHYMLLAICGLIYMDTAIGVTILSFVLPAAQCDLEMDSTAKGWLTASPMLGMVIGSYIWGCLADTKGRKIVLIATLLMDGIVGVASSFVQYFWVFVIFRFFNGFAVTGAMGICFPYLGEFQPTKYRERVLCWMEMFWTVGVIVLPLIAWLIIPMDFTYVTETFYFKSWNLFVALCALPSLMLGLWLFAFPESPKFLLECGEADTALEVFKWIYSRNTGADPDTYPVKCLQEKTKHQDKSTRSLKLHKRKDLKVLFTEIRDLTSALCKPPYLRNTVLACAIQFGLTSSYYTLMVWFPELFTRFEQFEHARPGETTSVCIVSAIPDNGTLFDPYGCDTIIASSVYLHTVYIGLACIPGSIILPIFVHKLGAKFFLIVSLVVSGAVTVGFYYVVNSTQNLIFSCVFEALTSLGISLVYCVIVDMFPTNLRVMAAALSLTMGRLGALVGNLVFGYLIDLACEIPIVLFAAFLFVCGILSFLLPKTGKETLE